MVLFEQFENNAKQTPNKKEKSSENDKKIINEKISNYGYFFDMNDDISIIYKLKPKYQSLKYDYKYFCKESNKLMNL